MKNKPRKILIIKTGFSEFLDRGVSTTVSLGDVLNCTSILHLYRNDHVTWLTSYAARQLLDDNPYVKQILVFGPVTLRRLLKSQFDILINLEKDIGICTILEQIRARKRFGFYFDADKHDISTCHPATRYLLSGQENHKHINRTFADLLYETVGEKWSGEDLILFRQRHPKVKYDIGFNYSVGSKWPTKAWPIAKWKKLEQALKNKYIISWQRGHKNIETYIDWIDSCRMIISSDSLGQVVGQALGKQVIALYGPTNSRRMQGMNNLTTVCSQLKCPHLPCYLPICKNDKFCMDYIDPQQIARLCEETLK